MAAIALVEMPADNAILDVAQAGGAVSGVHLCRGNGMGASLSSGGFDPIADKGLLIAGGPAVAGVRHGTRWQLRGVARCTLRQGRCDGSCEYQAPALESGEDLRRRIDEASAFVPMERLALSPQCGFASDFRGNPISEDDQWRKLELVASVANEAWGGVSART